MWNWVNCYLSGRHEFGVWCEPGAIFLRCVHCDKRSPGWSLDAKQRPPITQSRARMAVTPKSQNRRVIPFGRITAR